MNVSAPRTRHDSATAMERPLTLALAEIETKVRDVLGANRAAPVLSDTRRVLRELLMAERRVGAEVARSLLETEDLRGPLLRAEAFSRALARRAKREASARRLKQADTNRAGRVAKVVSIVLPEAQNHRGRRRMTESLPPAWIPVIESVDGSDQTACQKRRKLELIAIALARHGVLSPLQLSTDADELATLLVAEEVIVPKKISTAISNLRHALRTCVERGTLPPDAPLLRYRIGGKNIRGGAAWAGDRDAKLRAELPLWADDLNEYLELSEQELGTMRRHRRKATYRLAASLCEMRDAGLLPGLDLQCLQMRDLGTVRIHGSSGSTGAKVSRAAQRNGLQTSSTDTVPLVAALGDYMTAVVRRNKPCRGIPPIVYQDISRVWGICTLLVRPDPEKAPLEEQVLWKAADDLVRGWTNKAEKERPEEDKERNKMLLAEHLSLPLTVAFCIPFYTLLEMPAAAANVAAHPVGSIGRRDATARFVKLLQEWLALSTKIADPLRVEQRTFGRLGREIEVHAAFDSRNGVLADIHGVTTHIAGKTILQQSKNGTPKGEGGLKQHSKPPRSWDWSPSIVDFNWLARYFRDAWFPAVRSLGERGSMEDAMTSGRWTLFPTDASKTSTTHPYKGMSDDWISEKTGEAMLRVLREALGYRDLPAERKIAIHAGWKMLLSDHNARHLWATYWGGLRATRGPRQVSADGAVVESVSGMTYCMRATTDTQSTLERNYIALTQTVQRLLTRTVGSWSHPLSLDELMDRVTLTDRAVDWSAEWDRLAAIDGIDAMPPELRARWVGVRAPVRRRRAGRRR